MSQRVSTASYYAAIWRTLYQEKARREGWDLFHQDDGTFLIQKIDDVETMADELGVPALDNDFSDDDTCEEYVASRDSIMYQLAFYLQWRRSDSKLLVPEYWYKMLETALSEEKLVEIADFCANSPEGKHQPNWPHIGVQADGDDIYLDVTCYHCGRSGCLGRQSKLTAEITW